MGELKVLIHQCRVCINVLEQAVQMFTTTFSIFFFDRILKTSRATPFIVIWKSRLSLQSYSEGHKPTIFADKLITFVVHLVMVVANEGPLEELDI